MTVIAIRKTSKSIEMSCDSQTSYGTFYKAPKDNENDAKIFKINGLLVGGAGWVSESSLLKMFCKNHKPKDANEDGMMEFIYEFRDWVAKKTGKANYELINQFLIAYDGRVFEVYKGSVAEKHDFWAIGSGMFLALSALHFGKTTKDAVAVAKKYDLFCGGDTITLTMEKKS